MPVVTRRRSAELAALEARNVRPRTLVAHRPSKPQIFASEEQLFNEDIWTIIVGFLKALDLTSLALTSRFFHPIAMDDRVWKSLCMRHLQVAAPVSISPGLTWRRLYLSVFDPTHDFVRENEMHIDWRRVGIFTMTSGKALAAGRLWQATPEVSAAALCLIPYVRPGVWIAGTYEWIYYRICFIYSHILKYFLHILLYSHILRSFQTFIYCTVQYARRRIAKGPCRRSKPETGSSSITRTTKMGPGSTLRWRRNAFKRSWTLRLVAYSTTSLWLTRTCEMPNCWTSSGGVAINLWRASLHSQPPLPHHSAPITKV